MSVPETEAFDPGCRACPRLVRHLADVRREYPRYHGRPVAPFGDDRAQLLVVGLAPGMHGANATGRPFTGDHAGILLYRTLHKFGFASSPESLSRDDGLCLRNCRITNAVKCLPPENKPSADEVAKCNRFLQVELDGLAPGGLILGLGVVAHRAILRALGLKQSVHPFKHGARHRLPNGLSLLDSYHCSRYNTQTKRLTKTMFEKVLQRASRLVRRGS